MTAWEYMRVTAQASAGSWTAIISKSDGTRSEELVQSGGSLDVGVILLNRFGASGWELVSESVTERAVTGVRGFQHASIPASISWTFKRAIP